MDCTMLSRELAYLGRPVAGKIQLRFLLIILVHILSLLQIILGVPSRWKILQARFQSIEDLAVMIFMIALLYELANSKNLLSIFEIINRELYTRRNILTEKENAIMEDANRKSAMNNKIFHYVCSCFFSINGLIPYCYGIYFTMNADISKISQEEIPMPLECWFPLSLNDSFLYAVFVFPQVLCFFATNRASFCWFSATTCSLLHMEKEIDLLCLSIEEIDTLAGWNHSQSANNISKNDDQIEREQRLRLAFSSIVLHHQKIFRTVNNLNKALEKILFMLNYVCCAQICVSLYSFFEIEDRTSKVKYLLLLVPVFVCLFCFCWYGQQLSNKSEKLQRIILDCSWLNKPKWFQKCLQIMMLRASKPLQIKPYALYVLNLRNLMTVCQAAYSYFNLMHTMQIKDKSLSP